MKPNGLALCAWLLFISVAFCVGILKPTVGQHAFSVLDTTIHRSMTSTTAREHAHAQRVHASKRSNVPKAPAGLWRPPLDASVHSAASSASDASEVRPPSAAFPRGPRDVMPVLFLLTMLGSFAFALRRWLRGGRAPRLGPYYAALEASHGPDPSRPMWSMLAASVPPPSDREALKRNVLRLASAAPPVPRKDLVEAVEALEAVNPTRDPADSPLVSGCWALLFAGAVSDEAEAERARREGPVGGTISPRPAERQKPEAPEGRPLGRTLSNLKVGLATTKGNWQDIDAVNGKVRNRADIDLFWGSAPLAFCIDGSCQKVSASLSFWSGMGDGSGVMRLLDGKGLRGGAPLAQARPPSQKSRQNSG